MSSLSYFGSKLLPMMALRSGKAESSEISLVSFGGWKATVPFGFATSGTFINTACWANAATSLIHFFSSAITRD